MSWLCRWCGWYGSGFHDCDVGKPPPVAKSPRTEAWEEDVDLDEPRDKKLPGEQFDLPCGECQAPMVLRFSKKYENWFYGCSKFPKCKGTHGAHADGRPKGTPTNKAGKKARIKAHSVFDQLWQPDSPLGSKKLKRSGAYAWMRQAMGLSRSEAHIGHLNIEECEKLISLVYRDFPALQTRWTRLIHENDDLDFGVVDLE